MNLLLDTQCWLWMQVSPQRFAADALERLVDQANRLLLSAVSSWEIAIQYALGKLALPDPPQVYVPDRIRTSGVTPLAVEHSHALGVAALPLHHRDPFDRLLIAQAQLEHLTVVTADRAFAPYTVALRWAT